MKSLILYSSQSGNTEKLARAVYDSLEGEKELCAIDQAPSHDLEYDLVAVGFWLKKGKPDPTTEAFLKACKMNANVFFFATHGAAKGSDHAKAAMAYAASLLNGAEVVGTYSCQGEVNPKVLEKAKQKDAPPPWLQESDDAVGHPDDTDISELKAALKKAL
ncbi:MAG: flavodoxin family protein [Desulfotignum sp.]|nr:flavodoxin family protein [Desulfotignum sp.]